MDTTSPIITTLAKGVMSGGRVRSHADIAERARRIASGLDAFGIGPGETVCVLMRNDIVFIEAMQAIMMLGAYAVPVNWHFKTDEIVHVIQDCGARAIIGHADLLHQLAGATPGNVVTVCAPTPPEIIASYKIPPGATLAPVGAIELDGWLELQKPWTGAPRPQPQTMIYTSGTTGKPKGVRRDMPSPKQSRAIERLRAMIYGVQEGSRALLPGPLYHSAPSFFAMRASRVGDLLLLMPRFDAEGLLRLIEAEKIEVIFMVPTMFIRLLNLSQAVRDRYDVSSLRHIIHASAPCPVDVKQAMIDWWGPIINEFYGSTESGTVTFSTSEDALRKPGAVGKVVPGAELRFYAEDGTLLPHGQVGEIYSRIDDAPDFTYHNLPEKRAEVGRDGFITSGDVGYIDTDGYVFICDRKKDMVISGGVNIYPAEVEGALQTLPGVHDCAVFGIPDPEFGEALMAVVEPQPGFRLDVETVRNQLKARLAHYKVPKTIELGENLPREDSGKIFKRRLRDPYWEQAGRKI